MKYLIILFVILAISLSALSLKERRALMEKDTRDLVNIISDYDKIIDDQKDGIEDLEKEVHKLEIKKAFFRGRVFSMAANKSIIVVIIILIVVAGAVFVFLKFRRK